MIRGCAPEAREERRAIRPMGPAPQITAPRPRVSPARRMPWSTTERGSRSAPSAKLTSSGILVYISTFSNEEGRALKSLLVQPFCSMDLEALESTVVRPYARELYIFAKVVATFPAKPAIVTGHAGFDCYSIACFPQTRSAFISVSSSVSSFLFLFLFVRLLLSLSLSSVFPAATHLQACGLQLPSKSETGGRTETTEKKKVLTNRKIPNSLSKLEHNTRSLMPQNTITLHDQRTNTSRLPKVDV